MSLTAMDYKVHDAVQTQSTNQVPLGSVPTKDTGVTPLLQLVFSAMPACPGGSIFNYQEWEPFLQKPIFHQQDLWLKSV